MQRGASMGRDYSGPRPLSRLRLKGPHHTPRSDVSYRTIGTVSVKAGLMRGAKGKRSRHHTSRVDERDPLYNASNSTKFAYWGAQYDANKRSRLNRKSQRKSSI